MSRWLHTQCHHHPDSGILQNPSRTECRYRFAIERILDISAWDCMRSSGRGTQDFEIALKCTSESHTCCWCVKSCVMYSSIVCVHSSKCRLRGEGDAWPEI